MDLKAKYFEKADDLAWERFNKEFYDLTDDQQTKVWWDAELFVMEELQERVDRMREEVEIHKEATQK